MALSVDRLTSRSANFESKFSDPGLSPSSSCLSSSSSSFSGISCPSLTASGTLSSDGYSELETVLDPSDGSPTYSPFVGASSEFRPWDEMDLHELATPRPAGAKCKGYFPDLGQAEEEWCESGDESELMVGKCRRAAFKHVKARSFVKMSRRRPSIRRLTSGIPRRSPMDNFGTANLAGDSVPSKQAEFASVNRHHPTTPARTNCSAKVRPTSEMTESYSDIGLVRPSTRHGGATPKVNIGSTGKIPPLDDLVGREQRESPMKIVLKPMDSVLAFVETPSPVEGLPSPVFWGRDFPGLEVATAQGFLSTTPSRGSLDPAMRIGLGFIDVATIGSGSAVHGCSFKQCADYYSLPVAQDH